MNELKHYVGTGLKFLIHREGDRIEEEEKFTGIHFSKSTTTIWFGEIGYSDEYFDFKPILRPLDMLKYSLRGLEKISPESTFFSTNVLAADLWAIANGNITDWRNFKSDTFIFLIERQYDVFGLIERKLAIRSMGLGDESRNDFYTKN
ncbi:hypothetical protein [Ulvibacterium sp.]|uniref:hypothetical protein n=1 Tax=Ulvibacterium sp. TaxID=2665914 RepID=UPI0026161661|nr:hypothetical protein [Ulvibacterium sp.]